MATFQKKLLKIEKAVESKTVTSDIRVYLGVSTIGHPCKRYVWYSFRWFLPPKEISAKQDRLFSRGHREEDYILEKLKAVGVKVDATQSKMIDCYGHVQGHLDAILSNIPDAPKTPHLGEFKTSATKYFEALKKSGSVKKSFPYHYDQMQGYMQGFNLKRALYICVCKETDEWYYERVEYNKNYASNLFKKAEDIILATTEPDRISENKDFYRCGPKWCEYRNICHFQDTAINRTCRSCKHIELHDKGEWKCRKRKEKRNKEKQLKACKKWSR